MGNKTGIEWTDATWNPIRGCSRVSKGCEHCYAETMAHRFSGPGQPYEGLTQIVNGHPVWTGKVALVEKRLLDPLRWKGVRVGCKGCEKARAENLIDSCDECPDFSVRPRRIFVNSMSDLFHPNVPDAWIAKIVAVMVTAYWHQFQVLTKRPERMQPLLSSQDFWDLVSDALEEMVGDDWAYSHPLEHVWWGVSVEDQATADERIPLLLQTPAAVRFISGEPLVGGIDLRSNLGGTRWIGGQRGHEGRDRHGIHRHDDRCERGLDWVICGGESGPGARPMHPDWARSLRDQCASAGVPFFFKQWGAWLGAMQDGPMRDDGQQTINCSNAPIRVGKKAAGTLLDGREWKEFPR